MFYYLMDYYNPHLCENFIKEVSLFIYILDQRCINIIQLIEEYIESKLYSKLENSVQTLSDIYINLLSNYKDISIALIDYIVFFLKNLNSNIIINSIITEEEFFYRDNYSKSFLILKNILKKNILNQYPDLYETNYIKSTLEIGTKIANKIKNGEINFSLINEDEKKKYNKRKNEYYIFK